MGNEKDEAEPKKEEEKKDEGGKDKDKDKKDDGGKDKDKDKDDKDDKDKDDKDEKDDKKPAAPSKDPKEREREDKEYMRSCGFYHGLLPRDDIPYLLVNHGDYILRTSEVEGQATQITVISALIDHDGIGATKVPSERAPMVCNVIVNFGNGKCCIDSDNMFNSLEELVVYYKEHVVKINNMKPLELVTPIALTSWEYLHEDIVTKGKQIGAGAFGIVFKGELRTKKGKVVPVAVKSLKMGDNAGTKAKIQECMNEARLQRDFVHKNVVAMYGVAVMENPIAIILELAADGSLDGYLKKHGPSITVGDKLEMILGAAMGLQYLHAQSVLHRDIAARNCLYDKPNVKIADFGLSRRGLNYVMKTPRMLPIKWMAPECITKNVFNQKTETYSYGILVYEIFALKPPFENKKSKEVRAMLAKGQTMDLPPDCPDVVTLYIKQRVWNMNPDERPFMKEIVEHIEHIVGRTDLEGAKPAGTATVMTAIMPPNMPARTPGRKNKRKEKDKKKKKDIGSNTELLIHTRRSDTNVSRYAGPRK